MMTKMKMMVMGFALFAMSFCSAPFAMAVDPLQTELENLGPVTIVTPTWTPWPPRIIDDPGLCQAMARTLRCVSWNPRSGGPNDLQKMVAVAPENVAIHFSPYLGAFLNEPPWTKQEVCGPLTSKDIDYLMYFFGLMNAAKDTIGSIPVIVIFDFEIGFVSGPLAGSGCEDMATNENVVLKLNYFYQLVKALYDNPKVMFYNAKQWAPSYNSALAPPWLQSPVPITRPLIWLMSRYTLRSPRRG